VFTVNKIEILKEPVIERSDNMASNSQIMNINNFVSEFLETHQGSETLLEDWNSDEVQSALSAVVVKAMKKVSRKSKKDKNKPKRGSSAYIIFCGEERGNVIMDNPEMSAKEIVKELGARWTKLKLDNEDEITRLNGLSEIDKERYRTEMETYEPPVDDGSGDDDKPKKKKKKKQTGPKRGKSAYLFFCEKERKSIKDDEPDLPPKEVTIKLGHSWQELKEDEDRADEMSVFTDLAAKDKARYVEEKENWENSDVEDDHKPKKVPKAKKEATKKATSKKKAVAEDDEDNELVEEKAAAKKASAKKAAVKKAAAKKAAAKKAVAVAKKAVAKKAAAEEVEDDEDDEDDELVEEKAAPKKAAPKKAAPKKAAPKKAPKKAVDQEDDDELVEETKPKKKASLKKSTGKKMTGYVMFSKDFRKKAAEETPELKGAGVTKALALAWRALGNDGKEEWKAKAKDL
jgi:hypothetical protein